MQRSIVPQTPSPNAGAVGGTVAQPTGIVTLARVRKTPPQQQAQAKAAPALTCSMCGRTPGPDVAWAATRKVAGVEAPWEDACMHCFETVRVGWPRDTWQSKVAAVQSNSDEHSKFFAARGIRFPTLGSQSPASTRTFPTEQVRRVSAYGKRTERVLYFLPVSMFRKMFRIAPADVGERVTTEEDFEGNVVEGIYINVDSGEEPPHGSWKVTLFCERYDTVLVNAVAAEDTLRPGQGHDVLTLLQERESLRRPAALREPPTMTTLRERMNDATGPSGVTQEPEDNVKRCMDGMAYLLGVEKAAPGAPTNPAASQPRVSPRASRCPGWQCLG